MDTPTTPTPTQSVSFHINGEQKSWCGEPTKPLVDVIRDDLEWTGTKIGCRTGECGACTVLVDGKPVVSCLVPVASIDNHDVTTVESLIGEEDFQALVQKMADQGAVQCGFCTPGIVVTLYAWMQEPELFDGDAASALKNNLCRCTGYQSILTAVNDVLAAKEGER